MNFNPAQLKALRELMPWLEGTVRIHDIDGYKRISDDRCDVMIELDGHWKRSVYRRADMSRQGVR